LKFKLDALKIYFLKKVFLKSIEIPVIEVGELLLDVVEFVRQTNF